jgi:hypothetical protein
LSSGKKKIKIEFEDHDGSKYNLSLDGDISKNKILKIYELIETLSVKGENNNNANYNNNMSGSTINHAGIQSHDNLTSVGSKIWNIIESKFPQSTFTSSDVQEMYEEEYNESMRLDAIATYLSRYSNKGKLVRKKKGGKEWVYKIAIEKPSNSSTNILRDYSINRNENQFMKPRNQHNNQESSIDLLPTTTTTATNNFSSLTDVN